MDGVVCDVAVVVAAPVGSHEPEAALYVRAYGEVLHDRRSVFELGPYTLVSTR